MKIKILGCYGFFKECDNNESFLTAVIWDVCHLSLLAAVKLTLLDLEVNFNARFNLARARARENYSIFFVQPRSKNRTLQIHSAFLRAGRFSAVCICVGNKYVSGPLASPLT